MNGSKDLPGRAGLPCVAATLSLLALAGCGSTSKSATTTAATSATTPTTAASQSVRAVTYNVNLGHVAGSSGAASASGLAILTVKPPGELCWSISPVKNFSVSTSKTQATIVTIQPTPSGTPSTP